MSGRSGLDIRLVGLDDVIWRLLDLDSPVSLVGTDDGLHLPRIEAKTLDSPRIPGRRRVSNSVKSRTVSLSLLVGDLTPPYRVGDDWRLLDTALWSSLGLGQPITLVVGDRTLRVSVDDSVGSSTSVDPAIAGREIYSVTLTADWPYYEGPVREYPFVFQGTDTADFFNGASKAPPFNITPSEVFGTAAIANQGDVDAWPYWELNGPGGFTVGIGDTTITIPWALTQARRSDRH